MMGNNLGIYIHIPFCVKKCNYCAFLSAPSDAEGIERYVTALIDEIKKCKENFTYGNKCKANFTFYDRKCKENFTFSDSKCKANFTSIDSIYFGGGTPSLLTIEQISRILEEITDGVVLSEDIESTIEINPATLGQEDIEILDRLKSYRRLGINRLSMGVQSMNDDVLKYLGRIHNSDDVKRDFELARKAGFDNINLDLILSVPFGDDPMRQAVSDVKSLIGMNPEHISCYSLQLEEGTTFHKMYENGDFLEVSDETDREIYHKICSILEDNGYVHYEISNFAKSGKESRHNFKYWNMSDYLGFGLGASGFISGIRYKNTDSMNEYLAGNFIQEKHINTLHDTISEAVFLGLRRKNGIQYDEIFPNSSNSELDFWKYYESVREEAQNFVKSGHLIISSSGMKLTKSGIDISNSIMALFV